MEEDALAELQRLASGAQELRPLSEPLAARLAALAAAADRAGPSRDGDARRERALALLGEALALLRREQARATALRLADAWRVRRLRRLNEQLDEAFSALDASGRADGDRDWAREWPRRVEELEQHMLELASPQTGVLAAELRARTDQREALAAVKHAFERLPRAGAGAGAGATPAAAELQDHEELLRALFRRLVALSDVGVPSLPTWFVSSGDVRAETSRADLCGTPRPQATGGGVRAETLLAVWSRPDGREQRVLLKRVAGSSAVDAGESDGAGESESGEWARAKERAAVVAAEAALLARVRHPNVLRLAGACHVSRAPFVAFECPAPPGEGVVTLDEYLSISVDHQRLALRLLAQVARGLQALHAVGVAHGDVRCANILVGDDHRAKLANLSTFSATRARGADDGSSTRDELDDELNDDDDDNDNNDDNDSGSRRAVSHRCQRRPRGSPALRWQAPEVLAASASAAESDGDGRRAADVYALGVTLVEALAGELPWGFLADREVRQRVVAGELPPEAKALDETVTSLVEAMCDVNAAARPDVSTVVDELEALAEEEQARDGVQTADAQAAQAARLPGALALKVVKRGSMSDGMAETMRAIPRRRQSDAPLLSATMGVGGASDGRLRGLSSPRSRSGGVSPYWHSPPLPQQQQQQRRRPSSAASDVSKRSVQRAIGRGVSGYDDPGADAVDGELDEDESEGEDGSEGEGEDEQDAAAAVTTARVTLHSKWLGVKINSVGNRIVLSKFLRSESGAAGELEASRRVALGDEIAAVNGRRVRGALDRLQLGALVQALPRPLELTVRRDARLLASSLRFHGLRVDARWRDRGSALALPGALDALLGTHRAQSRGFALDLWFSLADVREDFYPGGVLLGAQDVDVDATSASAGSGGDVWPYVHRALLVVDPSGALWCDLLATPDGPLVVATDLVPGHWYHLVLSYAGNGSSAGGGGGGAASSSSSMASLAAGLSSQPQEQQLVAFLDGERRVVARGPLLQEWPRLRHVTLGTGCMSGLSPAKPSPSFRGWFGFSGLVHDLRLWHAPLSDVQSRQLFRAYGSRRGSAAACVDRPFFSLKRALRRPQPGAELPGGARAETVRATRPHHVVAQVYS